VKFPSFYSNISSALTVTGNVVPSHVPPFGNVVPVPETGVYFNSNSIKITFKQRIMFHVPRSIDPETFITVSILRIQVFFAKNNGYSTEYLWAHPCLISHDLLEHFGVGVRQMNLLATNTNVCKSLSLNDAFTRAHDFVKRSR
jgi:hypothetical protein